MGLLATLNGGTSCTATAAVGNHNNTTAAPKQRSAGVSGRIPPSTFSKNCGDCQSNASSLLDRPVVTMAPAVTEPLSPTEKLSSSTASPTATTTRSSSKKHQQELTDSSITTTATITDNASATSSAGERKSRHSAAISATTSTRLTRSKDTISAADTVTATAAAAAAAYQSVFEQAVTQSPAAVDPSSSSEGYETKTKINNIRNNNNNNTNNNNNNKSSNNNNKNDEMGLSTAAPSSNKKHNNNNKTSSMNNNNNSSCGTSGSPSSVVSHSTPPIAHPLNCRGDESTAQLLADLTDDFEEAITAEICLRKQLVEVNLDKGSVADSPTSRSSSSSTRPPLPTLQLSSEHMATPATGPAVECHDQQEEEQQQRHREEHPDDVEGDISNDTAQFSFEEQDMVTTAESQSDNSATQVEIQSVEELPPISTDSTMTASEAEDNLEERLSQLDGSAVDANSRDVPAAAAITTALCEMVPTTLPRTPQQQQQSHDSDHLLLEQLQQTDCSVPNASVASATAATTVGSQPQATHDMDDPDIMEVFKVLNTLDGTAGTEALTELNSLFNEVYTTLNCEEMGASGGGHQQHNQQNAAAIGALATPSTVALSPAKTSPIKELHAEIERKQLSMQRKIDFMLRRLRKTQARYMCNHVSEEIAGIFEYLVRGDGLKVQQPSSQLVKIKNEHSDAPSDASGGEGIAPTAVTAAAVSASSVDDVRSSATKMLSSRPPAKVWTDERKTPVPSSQVCAFLRKLEASATAQQLCTSSTSSQGASSYYSSTPARKPRKADVASSTSSASGVEQRPQLVPTLEPLVAEELMHVSGLLRSSLREVQLAVDSDATESSSGGESADEMITYNNQLQQPLAITKRAAWRYSRDRAAIASRWSWLLSQIADLEIKIRQHSELHQEIVRAKHAAVNGKSGTAATMSASSAALLMKGSTSTSVNGFKGDLSMLVLGDAAAVEEEEDPNALPGSCRTRGYSAEQFRKRKLLQTTNIHTISKKAARPSTIKCGCQWPQHPCALCTGRPDPTAPRDLLDTMMMSERVALVDPGYHPVLSFPGDVSNTLHFEAIARQSDWQHRVFRCQAKSIAKSVWRAEREAIAGGHHYSSRKYGSAGDMQPTKRRYIKKKDRLNEERMRGAAADGATASTASASVKQEQTQSQDGMSPDAGFDLEGDGNGIGSMTTPSGTPLVVANRPTKNGKKLNHPLTANGLLLRPRSPATNNKNSGSNSYIHQTSDCPPKSYDRYNPSQAHSSLISSSSKNNKYRKHTHHNNHLNSNSGKNNKHNSSQHQQNYRHQHYNSNNSSNPSQHYSTMNGGGDATNFLQSNPWDYPMGRSRPSSPTQQGGYSYFQKADRLFDRKNRASYDIDNVVIPYCLATTSRAEVLPYKEIPTPKWRVFDIDKDDDELDEDGNPQPTDIVAVEMAAAASLKSSDECDVPVENSENENVATCSNSDLNTANNSKTVTTMENKTDDSESTPRMSNIQIVDAVTPEKAKGDMAPPMEVDEPQSQSSPTISAPLSPPQVTAIAAATNAAESSDEPAAKKIKIDAVIEEQRVAAKQEEKKVEASPKMTIAPVASKDWRPALRRISGAHKLTIDELEEDISYEAMTLRHERALAEERRKFQTFLKFPWSTRSRANRRIDSRAESSGANTPDPTSPALQTPNIGGGDHESIPSPLAPSTQSLETISETAYVTNALHAPLTASQGGHRSERRRTTSAKKVADLERRSSTPDPKEPPYESLRFPLSDDVYDSLMRLMPSDYQNHDSKCSEDDSSFSADPSMASVLPLTRVTRSNRGFVPTQVTVKTDKICDQNSSATATVTSTGTDTNTNTNVSVTAKPYENGMAAAVQTDADNNVNEVVEQMEAHAPDNDDDDDEDEEDEDEADEDDADVDDAEADEDDADEDEEEDEDYQRHPFAPCDDLFDGAGTDVAMNDGGVGEPLAVGIAAVDTDGDTDMEPFQDDDPNDPEWKGETAVRVERPRNKL